MMRHRASIPVVLGLRSGELPDPFLLREGCRNRPGELLDQVALSYKRARPAWQGEPRIAST